MLFTRGPTFIPTRTGCSVANRMESNRAVDILTLRLAQYLGPAAAANTVHNLCLRDARVAPEALSPAQLARVVPGLQPLLSVLLGNMKTELLLAQLTKELTR